MALRASVAFHQRYYHPSNRKAPRIEQVQTRGLPPRLGIGGARRIAPIVQVGFTSNTSNHNRPHIHEPRPVTQSDVNQATDIRTSTGQDVLVENEKWLDGPKLVP
jgi:hypothetical protein